MYKLNEDTRKTLINKGKRGANYKGTWAKGKNRYQRRVHSRVLNSVKEFNEIDMNKLFKDNVLSVFVKVHGETDDYLVGISFGGFCEILNDQLKEDEEVSLRHIVKALMIGINKSDVFIRCNCPDFYYRFGFQDSVHNIIMGQKETRPSNITNPDNTLGSGCKHVLLVLNNTTWVLKCASVINNYINYMKTHYEKLYANVIYPAIYKKKYEEPVQTNLDDTEDDELATSEQDIDVSNEYGRTRTQFKKGNKQGIRFAKSKKDPDQIDLIIDDEEE